MKGLSVEEKAKRYDEIIEQLRTMMPNWESLSYNGKTFLQDLVYIIPELKKDEDEDEKTRKYLISFVKLNSGFNLSPEYAEQMLAWLEKQGKNNIGISEATKQKLDDNLHKALEKETRESWNEFLDGRGEQKPAWSEEDETVLTNTIIMLKEGASLHFNKKDITKAVDWLKSLRSQTTCKPSGEHYELEEFAKIVRGNLTDISKAVQELFEAKYLQLTGNKMYRGFKD